MKNLKRTITELVEQCSPQEQKSVVAFCCYMAFRDKSFQRDEVDFVRALAAEVGIPDAKVTKLARKVRKRKLRINCPQTQTGRNTLFRLALHTAVADRTISSKERKSIDRLAKQLNVTPQVVEAEMQVILGMENQEFRSRASGRSVDDIFAAVSSDLVTECLEADLFSVDTKVKDRLGEIEFLRRADGQQELSIELEPSGLPNAGAVELVIGDAGVCRLELDGQRIDRTLTASDAIATLKLRSDQNVAIIFDDETILTGTFKKP